MGFRLYSPMLPVYGGICLQTMGQLDNGLGLHSLRIVCMSFCSCSTPADDVPVIVVGGGAALCGDSLAGASAVIRPEHADVANAVGAAMPQVSY